jgi:hypothetical protein
MEGFYELNIIMKYKKSFNNFKKSGLVLLLFFIFLLTFYNYNFILNNHQNCSNPEYPKTSNNVAYEWDQIWSISENTYPNDVVLDNQGNIYITGYSTNYYLTGYDYFLMSIESRGNLNWSCIWGTKDSDFGYDLELFNSFFYVLGRSNYSYEITKLNREAIVGDTISLNERVSSLSQSMKMDQYGNFYIVGSNFSQDYDLYIAKLNLTGGTDWELIWDSGKEDWGDSLTLDIDNNVYAVGRSYNSDYSISSLTLLKCDNVGNLMWSSKKNFNDYFGINQIIVDQLGNIYIVGSQRYTSNEDYNIFLLKYSNLGVLQWNFIWGGNKNEHGDDLVIDNAGNIYVLGDTYSYGHGECDICLLKLNPDGDLLWTYFWGGSDYDYGKAISIDSHENIYVVGYTRSFGTAYYNLCLIKFGVDSDDDGLTDNDEEKIYLTDKYNPDTDKDGINDGDEINRYGTNPLNKDTDSDLFSDYAEIFIFSTDPSNSFNNPIFFASIYSLVGITGILIGLYIYISIKERREKEKGS